MRDLFLLEFRTFLDNSKICYSQEENLFVINNGHFVVKLVSFEDYKNYLKCSHFNEKVIFIHLDRWLSKREIVKSMILVKAGKFESVFARSCRIERVDKTIAKKFHHENHLIGEADSKFNYALIRESDKKPVSVSSFSSSRIMRRDDKSVLSYEWVRHTSLKGIRVVGGMSKVLDHFIKDISPGEIMTYCDADWSDGASYQKLGFETYSTPVESEFYIDKFTFERISLKKIRREFESLSPDILSDKFIYLRTQGNYKLLRRISF